MPAFQLGVRFGLLYAAEKRAKFLWFFAMVINLKLYIYTISLLFLPAEISALRCFLLR